MNRVCIFFKQFLPFHVYKDPGQIVLGLMDNGIATKMITIRKNELLNYNAPFPLEIIDNSVEITKAMVDCEFIIFYSWLSPIYNKIFINLNKMGKKIVIKADRRGNVGIIRQPREKLSLITRRFVSSPKYAFKQSLKTVVGFKYEAMMIKQIELSNALAIETPDAAEALNFFLIQKGKKELIRKIRVVPDPVTPDFINTRLLEKENIVISVGRWNDKIPKNPKGLVKTLSKFLDFKKNWRTIIIGPGENIIKKYIENVPNLIKKRITVTGNIEHEKIKDYLLKSKVFFMPSRRESFGIAAAEALCCGCSVVGTPIESLRYLTMQGFSGNVSNNFSVNSMVGTLIHQAEKWERGEVNFHMISEFWKSKLDRKVIAKQFIKIMEKL